MSDPAKEFEKEAKLVFIALMEKLSGRRGFPKYYEDEEFWSGAIEDGLEGEYKILEEALLEAKRKGMEESACITDDMAKFYPARKKIFGKVGWVIRERVRTERDRMEVKDEEE